MANGQNPTAASQQQEDPLAKYRESVVETLAMLEGLADECQSLPDLIEMLRLAAKNDSQLKFIIKKAGPVVFRG